MSLIVKRRIGFRRNLASVFLALSGTAVAAWAGREFAKPHAWDGRESDPPLFSPIAARNNSPSNAAEFWKTAQINIALDQVRQAKADSIVRRQYLLVSVQTLGAMACIAACVRWLGTRRQPGAAPGDDLGGASAGRTTQTRLAAAPAAAPTD